MNTNPQLDLHPDVESLSAFAEHQLPEHEREPIIAHLATCAHCRQILFLAQDATEEAQPAIAGPVLVSTEKKFAPNWRYAWGALAACAALATISIVFYSRHPAAPQEQAKIAAPTPNQAVPAVGPPIPAPPIPAPPAQGKTGSASSVENRKPLSPRREADNPSGSPSRSASRPASAPAPKPATSLDFAMASPVPATPAPQPPAPQQQAAAGSSTTLNITLKPAQASQTVSVQAENLNVDVAPSPTQLQPYTPPVTETMNAQVVQPDDQVKLQSQSVHPVGGAHASQKAAVADGYGYGISSGAGGGAGGGVRGTMAGRPVGAPRAPASFARMARPPLTVTPADEAAAHDTLGKILPSGLAAVATASASHHLLAVDSAGALFLSEDAGAVWEPISAQWTGRAVLVLAPHAAATHAGPDQISGRAIAGTASADVPAPAAAAPASPAAPPAGPPAALFEIVNDQGIHWTSSDGRTWKAK